MSPDEAFALITEPERLRRWQTVSAVGALRAGGEYRWTITPGHVAAGTFREVEPGRRIIFGWGWEGNDDLKPDASTVTVTVTVEPADGGSRVTPVHEGLTEEQAAMHAEGWNHYFERLQKVATTGDASQDEWAFAPENLTPITAAEAALAVLQPVLRNLTPEDRPKPTPCTEFTCIRRTHARRRLTHPPPAGSGRRRTDTAHLRRTTRPRTCSCTTRPCPRRRLHPRPRSRWRPSWASGTPGPARSAAGWSTSALRSPGDPGQPRGDLAQHP